MMRRYWLTLLLAGLCMGWHAAPAVAEADQDESGLQDGDRRATLVSEAAHEQFIFAHRLYLTGRRDHAAVAFDEYLEQFEGDEKYSDALFFRADLALRAGELDKADDLIDQIDQPRFVKPAAMDILHGQLHFEQGRYEQAVEALERIDFSDLGEQTVLWVRHLRGRAYARSGNFSAAAGQFEQVAEIDGARRASALFELAQARAELDQHEASLEAARRCVVLHHPQISPRAAAFAADLAHEKRKYDEVIDFTRAIIEHHQAAPQFGRAVVDLMWALHATGRFEVAIQTGAEHYARLDAEKRHTVDYVAGLSYYELGDRGRAAQHFQRVHRQAPGWHREANVLYMLGLCLFELQRYDEMGSALRTLIRNHGDSEQAARGRMLLVRADIARGEYGDAIERLGEIIGDGEDNPVYADARLQRGHLRERDEQWDSAAADYEAFLQWAGEDGAASDDARLAMLRLAHVRFQAGRFEAAERVAGTLLEQDGLEQGMREHAMYQRAQALIRKREHVEAGDQLEALIEAYPEGRFAAAARYWRGVLHLAAGEPEEAVPMLRAAGEDERFDRHLRANGLRLAAEALRRKRELDEVRATMAKLEALIGRDELTAAERLWLGRDRVEQAGDRDDYRAALRYLQPLMDREDGPGAALGTSQATEAELLVALCMRELRELEAAERGFNRVVTRGHGFASRARLELARTYAKQDRRDRAIEEYGMLLRAAARIDEKFVVAALYEAAELYRARARDYEREGRDGRAGEDHKAADQRLLRIALMYPHPRFTPKPQMALIELEQRARGEGRSDDARRYREQLIEHFPDTPFAAYAEAMQELDRGRPAAALHRLEALRDREEPMEPQLLQIVQTTIERLERES